MGVSRALCCSRSPFAKLGPRSALDEMPARVACSGDGEASAPHRRTPTDRTDAVRASTRARERAWISFHGQVLARTREAGSLADIKPLPLFHALASAAGDGPCVSRPGFQKGLKKLGFDCCDGASLFDYIDARRVGAVDVIAWQAAFDRAARNVAAAAVDETAADRAFEVGCVPVAKVIGFLIIAPFMAVGYGFLGSCQFCGAVCKDAEDATQGRGRRRGPAVFYKMARAAKRDMM